MLPCWLWPETGHPSTAGACRIIPRRLCQTWQRISPFRPADRGQSRGVCRGFDGEPRTTTFFGTLVAGGVQHRLTLQRHLHESEVHPDDPGACWVLPKVIETGSVA